MFLFASSTSRIPCLAPFQFRLGRCAGAAIISALCLGATARACPPTVISPPNGAAHQFGWSMANTGDVDRDGYLDLAIGDPTGRGQYAGRVNIFSGRDLSPLWVLPTTDDPLMGFGESVAGAGDIDDDGYADLLVGIDGGGNVQGQAAVFSGRTHEWLASVSAGARSGRFGSSVATLGDVNGDDRPDFIVGARNMFKAYVFSGLDFSLLYTLDEQEPGEGFASAISGIGDLDGDHRPDVLVGARDNNYLGVGTGRVYAFSGADGSLIGSVNGDRAESRFGGSLANLGDVNGDQVDDLLVGAPGWMNQQGRATVVSGATLAVLLNVDGETDSQFGYSVAAAGDVDGDLLPDLLIGAPRAKDDHNRSNGRIYLVSSDGTLIRTEDVWGEHSEFGKSVAGGFAFDGDGVPDCAAAAPTNGFGAAAFAYLSDCTMRLSVIASCPGGGPIEVSWENATPDALVALVYSSRMGQVPIPSGQPCAGTLLGLGPQQLQVVYLGNSGPDGSRVLVGSTGSNACGGFLQLLDVSTCTLSDVESIE